MGGFNNLVQYFAGNSRAASNRNVPRYGGQVNFTMDELNQNYTPQQTNIGAFKSTEQTPPVRNSAPYAWNALDGLALPELVDRLAKRTGFTNWYKNLKPNSKVLNKLHGLGGSVGGQFANKATGLWLLADAYQTYSDIADKQNSGMSLEEAITQQPKEYAEQLRNTLAAPMPWDVLGVMSPFNQAGLIGHGIGEAVNLARDYFIPAVSSADRARQRKAELQNRESIHRNAKPSSPAAAHAYRRLRASEFDPVEEGWRLGPVGLSGSHPFRDAILKTQQNLAKNAPRDPRIASYDQLLKQYNQEVGFFGEGEFPNIIRSRVSNLMDRTADLEKRLQVDPTNTQLREDLQRAQQRLQDLYSWGARSRRRRRFE